MYGALRWVESHGGKQIVIIGHRGINEMYKRLGFQALGLSAQSVCKSMSKVYALSGARVAYLCGGQHQMEPLRTITPPWVISMPAQLAGVYALDDPSYYEARYKETHILREAFSSELCEIGLEVFPSVANFLLCKLPEGGKCAKDVVGACVLEGVYLRDVSSMGTSIGANYLRIAVKNKLDNERILNALKTAING